MSYEQPSSPVSHINEQFAHWRNTRFAQMVAIVQGEAKPDESDGNPDIRFSRSAPAPAAGAPAGAATAPFKDRMDKVVDSLIYNFQDRFKPLKDIQKRAAAVPEAEDASLAEERYSGTVRARTDDFEAAHRTPLVKAFHDSYRLSITRYIFRQLITNSRKRRKKIEPSANTRKIERITGS